MARSVAEIRERFSAQIEALRAAAEKAADSVLGGGTYAWFDPDGWNGVTADLAGMSEPFDREEHNEDMRSAIKDGDNPGTIGDLQATVLQGEYLAAMEQAFRMRHCGPVRAAYLAAARRRGHGKDGGPLVRGVKGYIENLLRVSKEDS